MRGNMGNVKQWASESYTASAAGTDSVDVSLPAGQTGKPVKMRVSGSVSGQAAITYGNAAQIIAPCNPNAPFTEVDIPSTAFPSPTNAVNSISVTADGAGVIRVLIGFA